MALQGLGLDVHAFALEQRNNTIHGLVGCLLNHVLSGFVQIFSILHLLFEDSFQPRQRIKNARAPSTLRGFSGTDYFLQKNKRARKGILLFQMIM